MRIENFVRAFILTNYYHALKYTVKYSMIYLKQQAEFPNTSIYETNSIIVYVGCISSASSEERNCNGNT